MRRYRIPFMFSTVIVGVFITIWFFLPDCDVYGGLGITERSCECQGLKVTVQDKAEVDGLTITKCVGLTKQRTCRKWDQKELGPCEE